jgi:8-oxo-dGTP pyrophosphatase MutT (NUDIX family)
MNTLERRVRPGAYGIATEGSKILMVIQLPGAYTGLFDLPGGGIEFGETVEQALHREFLEEVGMGFSSYEHVGNFSATVDVPSVDGRAPYGLHQVGLIYAVKGLYPIREGELKYEWVELASLNRKNTALLAWQALTHYFTK